MTHNNDSSFFSDFFKLEAAGGIILFITAALAIIAANSPLDEYYQLLLSTPVGVSLGEFSLNKPALLWINDGLMAVFFFLVGLELKRELVEGELSDKRNVILPALGAVGGMLVPALIYVFFNHQDAVAQSGWAIPAATDIAFALGVLTLLGSSVPTSVKIFLTSLAIFDDIGAIVIIALFYTSKLSLTALGVAAVCMLVLWYLNRRGVLSKSPYLLIGLIMWVATLKSGVHATLAGVVLAMFIPLKSRDGSNASPLKELEHDLHNVVAFFVLPVFAFANAGLNLSGITSDQILHSVSLGIALGLFIGKPLGIFGICWLAVKFRLITLPKDMTLSVLLGVSILCGIGFTMSLFIGSLAFEQSGVDRIFDERLGIIIGSLCSGILGFIVLRFALKRTL